ncbi:iron-containing redox enzyme family protein [Cryobacterium sp. PH31-L1]|uniref:iron-containing redox enzyme family protein n=1 Tax=Cryobacterium sp. PH31-L1 TaxID=3046199 RepID=UPI0024B9E7AE|nr:iron-containing redox enzyme family protein [Cryobacterium sp. PH31-L1]MDJ0379050.1 iron-containing redox enzyme family protein [Cryobacterium sp. PH31-L1]
MLLKLGGMTTLEALAVSSGPAFTSRGPLSTRLLHAFEYELATEETAGLSETVEETVATCDDVLQDDDVQFSLFLLYGLSYGDVIPGGDAWEWHSGMIAARRVLENAFEGGLRNTVSLPQSRSAHADDVAATLFALTKPDSGPSLSRHFATKVTQLQATEFVVQRSIYTLKEADPHSWAIPRLTGRAKAALVEIQADEYGGGRPERMHSAIFAGTMRGLGLNTRYGAYVDHVPAITLASLNTMSLFGLQRRLRGALVGHLAAFEMTSSIPNRKYGDGFRRLGYGADVTRYFDEHVEADAVHEQIAARDLAGALAAEEPALLDDILFGASACLLVDGLMGQHMLDAWAAGRSSLRIPLPVPRAAERPAEEDVLAKGQSQNV